MFIVEAKGISKDFPGVKALTKVDFKALNGEVHALVGENGAGKSTLVKIFCGVHHPEEGELFMQGQKIVRFNPMDAQKNGVTLIFQELAQVPALSVAENIFLGRLPLKKFGIIDNQELYRKAEEALKKLGCPFDIKEMVGNLSAGNRQMVEIARALTHDSKLIIFDEPTASLCEKEANILFNNIRLLKEHGVCIVYITHKLEEVFKISDRITVMRDGMVSATINTKDTNEKDIVKLMIGRNIDESTTANEEKFGKEVLRVTNFSQRMIFDNINFSVHRGEILGFFGLIGAGRSEVMNALFGVNPKDGGTIFIDGKEVRITNPKDAVNHGIGLVPEDRKEQGLILNMTVRDNLTLVKSRALKRLGLSDNHALNALFNTFRKRLSIKTPNPKTPALNLSGGNQQKVVIGKWLSIEPKILILDEPTRGIDVGSKSEIHSLIAKLAVEDGIAIIMVSSEMPEIIRNCDRVIVMCEGRITSQLKGKEITENTLIQAATLFSDNKSKANMVSVI